MNIEFTLEALATIQRMDNRVREIGAYFGNTSEEFNNASNSLRQSLVAMIGLRPERVATDGELSLFCSGGVMQCFGVNVSSGRLSDENAKREMEYPLDPEYKNKLVVWSVNS